MDASKNGEPVLQTWSSVERVDVSASLLVFKLGRVVEEEVRHSLPTHVGHFHVQCIDLLDD